MNVKSDNISAIYKLKSDQSLSLPIFSGSIPAGFASPAEAYLEGQLDLRDLVDHPAATFVIQVYGLSMINAGINPGDLLLVDKAVDAQTGMVVVAYIYGDNAFTVKRLEKISETEYRLLPENPDFKPIEFHGEDECKIWGVVSYAITPLLGQKWPIKELAF